MTAVLSGAKCGKAGLMRLIYTQLDGRVLGVAYKALIYSVVMPSLDSHPISKV